MFKDGERVVCIDRNDANGNVLVELTKLPCFTVNAALTEAIKDTEWIFLNELRCYYRANRFIVADEIEKEKYPEE